MGAGDRLGMAIGFQGGYCEYLTPARLQAPRLGRAWQRLSRVEGGDDTRQCFRLGEPKFKQTL